MFELAKVSSQGQVTIPVEVRKALNLKAGDKVAFYVNEKGEVVVGNPNLIALKRLQEAFRGASEETGITTDEEVVELVKEVRKTK